MFAGAYDGFGLAGQHAGRGECSMARNQMCQLGSSDVLTVVTPNSSKFF